MMNSDGIEQMMLRFNFNTRGATYANYQQTSSIGTYFRKQQIRFTSNNQRERLES